AGNRCRPTFMSGTATAGTKAGTPVSPGGGPTSGRAVFGVTGTGTPTGFSADGGGTGAGAACAPAGEGAPVCSLACASAVVADEKRIREVRRGVRIRSILVGVPFDDLGAIGVVAKAAINTL